MSASQHDLAQLADEYVLGLLDSREHAEIETRLAHDALLQAEVVASQERFLSLDLTAKPLPPGSDLWQRIEAGLERPDQESLGRQSDNPAGFANDNAGGRYWQRLAIAASICLALVSGVLIWSLANRPDPVVIAVLLNQDGEPQALIEDFGKTAAKVTLLTDYEVPEGRTIQAWTLPSQEMGPVSLGLVRQASATVLEPPALPLPREEQLYELTLEQAGGSPTGRPTGPILAKGFARKPR
jgi:anti-sigma-K factor RskA